MNSPSRNGGETSARTEVEPLAHTGGLSVPVPDKKSVLYCSFCGKGQYEVGRLIAAPTCFICNECVALCVTILLETPEPASSGPTSVAPQVAQPIRDDLESKGEA